VVKEVVIYYFEKHHLSALTLLTQSFFKMLSPKNKRNISRIIPFALTWLLYSIVFSLLERGLLGNLTNYPSTGNPYHFSTAIISAAITALALGLLIGTMEILYINKLFLKKSFLKKIIYKTTIYLGIIILFLLVNRVIYNSIELKAGVFTKLVWLRTGQFFFNYVFGGVAVYITTVVGVSLFYNEISENLGRGTLANFFTGKYHTPKEEERIFMFLDMKSSTHIAENLGHVKYFEMLREYYLDLSDAIVKYSGEIYQYVGDEVVVSWKLKGVLENKNCIECFFAMKEALQKQTAKYNERFGIVPGFKAGFHLGKVTTGEIGVIKKDIIFTGDVLNTTARIQGLCNTYKVDILISGDLIKELNISAQFQIKNLGENELRGRDEKIELFTISRYSKLSIIRETDKIKVIEITT
jgi:adenylate cyclase